MADKPTSELTPEARDERERCLAVLKSFERLIGEYYIPIANRIRAGNDPRDPDYLEDRIFS